MVYKFKVSDSGSKSVTMGYPPHNVHYSIHHISTKRINATENPGKDFNSRVTHFEKVYKQGETIPPILVHKNDEGTYNVLDGHARLEAYRRMGIKRIPVVENLFGQIAGKAAAAFRGGVGAARRSYAVSREKQRYRAELQLEELKRKARAGNLIVQRYLDREGIQWRVRRAAPPMIILRGGAGEE